MNIPGEPTVAFVVARLKSWALLAVGSWNHRSIRAFLLVIMG